MIDLGDYKNNILTVSLLLKKMFLKKDRHLRGIYVTILPILYDLDFFSFLKALDLLSDKTNNSAGYTTMFLNRTCSAGDRK